MKGQDYSELLDSYVLFICTYDPFKKVDDNSFCLPCYTFKNICIENSEVSLDDKSVKVIYNAGAYEAVKDEKIRDFLHFICTNEPEENNFSQTLSDAVAKLKDDEKFRSYYAAMNLHDRDIKKIAREEGRSEKAVEDAVMLVKKYNAKPEVAAADMNAPLDKVLEALKTI